MSTTAPSPNDPLALALLQTGGLDAVGLARAEALARSAMIPLDRALLRLGLMEEPALLRVLAGLQTLDYLEDSTGFEPSGDVIDALGLTYLRRNLIFPVEAENGAVTLLCADPANSVLLGELAFQLDLPVKLIVTPSRAILKRLDGLSRPSGSALSDEQASHDKRSFDAAQMDGPVIKFVSQMLSEAVSQGASDLHFVSADSELDLRFRINGVLARQGNGGSINPSAVIARIKVMSGLNVAERRRPQDGRMTAVIGGRVVDFRVSALPTQQGESIVVRVLDPRALRLGWQRLGFSSETEEGVREIVERPSGLFLVTGPTGSGKTTTLYTAINHLRSERRKIITIEDPVEYQIAGVEQVQVQDDIGLSFAAALRSVLRQDPNVIMVGEIRDPETAEIACRAALVGRMVLSTLHTNSARGALPRLKDLGVDEFIVRDVLRGVLGQELQIVPCSECSGQGCGDCDRTGTRERKLKAELLRF